VLATNAFAQGSFCTTSAAASGVSVTKCVDAPSPTPSATASPEVTVISGGPLTPSPTATATATGATANPVVAAVGGELPATGGAARLALIAAALLLGSGVLSYFIMRRV
jgi:LPXTG-motif cell wall-anchored protein